MDAATESEALRMINRAERAIARDFNAIEELLKRCLDDVSLGVRRFEGDDATQYLSRHDVASFTANDVFNSVSNLIRRAGDLIEHDANLRTAEAIRDTWVAAAQLQSDSPS